jgi:hypothetical protein
MQPHITTQKVLDGKFHGRRPVGRPRLRWEENIRRDSLLLNIRGWRRWAGDRDSGGELLKRSGPNVGCSTIKEEEEEAPHNNNNTALLENISCVHIGDLGL